MRNPDPPIAAESGDYQILSINDIAQLARKSPRWVQERFERGDIKHFRHGNRRETTVAFWREYVQGLIDKDE